MPAAPSPLALAARSPSLVRSIGAKALHGDPALAFAAFRGLALQSEPGTRLRHDAELGLGRSWLLVGRAALAGRYAEKLVAERPRWAEAWALRVRALLRAGDFRAALDVAEKAAARVGLEDPELRAAHASALFRNQRLREAEAGYRELLSEDPANVEALVRLGTGLLPPGPARVVPELRRAIAHQRAGRLHQARLQLARVLGGKPDHPTALRLLGELLVSIERARSPLVADGFFEDFWTDLVPAADLRADLHGFFRGYRDFDSRRKRMISWSARPFSRRLLRVAAAGGRHDLLLESERTTDAAARAWLRGKRTFDGRVWDDVRGIGGLCAATGIEALDDAHAGGFQTLVHELAHQVHLYALPASARERITRLYGRAKRNGRCLDYYAAANEAEYFAQGVEAFFSYAKAAGQPVTHGHTHFELQRRDPELYAFIRGLSEIDPLRGQHRRLRSLLAAALRVARADDARTILEWLPAAQRKRYQRAVRRAEARFETL